MATFLGGGSGDCEARNTALAARKWGHTFPPRPKVLLRARLRAGFLKGPGARGRSQQRRRAGAVPGRAAGVGWAGPGQGWRWLWYGSQRYPARGEGGWCKSGGSLLTGWVPNPQGGGPGTPPPSGRAQTPRAGRGRGPAQRPDGGSSTPTPWRQSRAFPVAVEERAGLLAPPWEVHCPFVLAGPPPVLVECLHWRLNPDSLPLPGG